MMNDDKMSSSDGDGVEISSDILFGRDDSMKMASPQVNNALLRKASHDDHAALRDDEESVASSVSSVQIAQCRGKSKAENNRHVFDDLTKVKLNTSLAHPGRGEMWFGDLDFDFGINGEWVQDTRRGVLEEQRTTHVCHFK
eukprot:scaffold12923_cov127-Skeletonema_dohrnii-CCMP3373.AAC.3